MTLLQAYNASAPPSGIPLTRQPADLDSDGLSDEFERSATAAEPDRDDDGDEAENREEELFGTDPRNPQSSLGQALTSTPAPNGGYRVTILTQAARRYWLEGTDDLVIYNQLMDPRDGFDSPLIFTTPKTEDTFKAYRIRVVSPLPRASYTLLDLLLS